MILIIKLSAAGWQLNYPLWTYKITFYHIDITFTDDLLIYWYRMIRILIYWYHIADDMPVFSLWKTRGRYSLGMCNYVSDRWMSEVGIWRGAPGTSLVTPRSQVISRDSDSMLDYHILGINKTQTSNKRFCIFTSDIN